MKDLQCSNTVKQDEGVLKLKKTITSTGCKGSVLIETTQGFPETWFELASSSRTMWNIRQLPWSFVNCICGGRGSL